MQVFECYTLSSPSDCKEREEKEHTRERKKKKKWKKIDKKNEH